MLVCLFSEWSEKNMVTPKSDINMILLEKPKQIDKMAESADSCYDYQTKWIRKF